jgi:nitrogen fixation protein NifB
MPEQSPDGIFISEIKPQSKAADVMKKHPCMSGEAHLKFGRIHLPVSPLCNIGCKFCGRGIHKGDVPGAASRVLTPTEAVDVLARALELCPEITVAGVAGPGDALASPHAIETFRLIGERFPGILKCLSTNGLRLLDNIEGLKAVGIDSLTITVNSLNPETLVQINGHVQQDGKLSVGLEAAEILINAQFAGLAAAAHELDAVIKINTVLIPGVNDGEIADIARKTAFWGASIHNIIPLIPQHGMADRREPDCTELNAARQAAAPYLDVFRHCRRCRADAAGVMGKNQDISNLLYGSGRQAEDNFSHG